MRHAPYRQQDYAFGELMLSLRSAIGVTQAGLGTILGVSRQSIVDWEAGGKYPKTTHLQAFIELAMEHGAFSTGRERDEIRALWKASRQKVLIDDAWLTELLITRREEATSDSVTNASVTKSRFHWDSAYAVDTFFGREWELKLLREWVVEKRCRVVTLLGLGGIGKSALAIRLMHEVAEQFEVVIWRSLRDLPSCDALLIDLLQVVAPQVLKNMPVSLEPRLQLLMEQLRNARILLVLDNVESVLEEGQISGRIRAGYEGFGYFLRLAAETKHQSSVILTSRQKPNDLLPHEGSHTPVRTLRLMALNNEACEQLLTDREVTGSTDGRIRLIETYAGNPLALKIVAQTVVDLFGGDVQPFLEQGGVSFGGVHVLLHEQYKRLSADERQIVVWLAIMREPITLSQLQALSVAPLATTKTIDSLNKLYQHSLIERGQTAGSFTLQSVVMEYLIEQIINEASEEILRGELSVLIQHGLEQAQVKDYVRETQTRSLIAPLIIRLQSMVTMDVEARIYSLLNRLRQKPTEMQGYAPANLTVMLRHVQGHLRGVDLSRLMLRGVHLKGVEMHTAQLTGAVIRDCTFTETFDSINAITMSRNGQYWAASSETGEVRLWDASNHTLMRLWSNASNIMFRIALSADGRRLAGGTWDGRLKVWDVADGSLMWTVSWPKTVMMIFRIGFSPDGSTLFCVGSDAKVRLMNARDGVEIQTIPTLKPVNFTIWNPDGKMLATAENDGTIRLWAIDRTNTIEPAKCVCIIPTMDSLITSMSFSPDGQRLVSGNREGIGKFWDVNSGQQLGKISNDTVEVFFVTWSPDGRTVIVCGYDNMIWLWDVESNSYRSALQGHTGRVNGAHFYPDSQQIISGSADGTVRTWDVRTEKCTHTIYGYTTAINNIGWSPDSQQIVSTSTNTSVNIFSVDGTPTRVLRGHDEVVMYVAWSTKGGLLASVEKRGSTIRVWDTKLWECVHILSLPKRREESIYHIEWSPDGQWLFGGTFRHGIAMWDFSSNPPRLVQSNFPKMVSGRIIWSVDGTRIATLGRSTEIYIFDADGQIRWELNEHQTQVTDVIWLTDDMYVVSVSTTEMIVWDAQSGDLVKRIEAPNGFNGIFSALEAIYNTHIVIIGSSDGKLRWWDTQLGEVLWTRDAHAGSVQCLRRSPDGTKLASAGDDGAVMIWDLATGEHLQTLRLNRPYEGMDITGIRGLTEAQLASLQRLGATKARSS